MSIRELFTEDTYACYAWNKLCKRELFDTIRFPVGRVMEDLGIAHKILFDAGQIAYSDEPCITIISAMAALSIQTV